MASQRVDYYEEVLIFHPETAKRIQVDEAATGSNKPHEDQGDEDPNSPDRPEMVVPSLK